MTSIGSIVRNGGFMPERDLNESLTEFQDQYAGGLPIRYLMMSPFTTGMMVLIPNKIVGYDEDGDPIYALSTRIGTVMVFTDPSIGYGVIEVHTEDC